MVADGGIEVFIVPDQNNQSSLPCGVPNIPVFFHEYFVEGERRTHKDYLI